MEPVKLFTIGFTQKNAENFFTTIQRAGIRMVIDIRLNNVSQLAGFTKKDDLKYFLSAICGCGYRHEPQLARTKEILDDYKENGISWPEYEKRFNHLLSARRTHKLLKPSDLHMSCLLCSEASPQYCHRRLVAEYFQQKWKEMEIQHL